MTPKSKQKAPPSAVENPAGGPPADPGLWLVATPIGNARDITLRALDALKWADTIACEDTRVTKKLLAIHGIAAKSLVSYRDHNAEQAGPEILETLAMGGSVALVSDAGSPMINDPGYRLASKALAAGHAVTGIPGPSAVLVGLQLSGLATDRFHYFGFPPQKSAARQALFREISDLTGTLVFLENPKRLAACLRDLIAALRDRPAAVARELTKVFEDVRRDSLSALLAHYMEAGPPKGEATLIVGGAETGTLETIAETDIDDRLEDLLKTMRMRDAVDAVTAETGLARRTVYRRALAVRDARGS